MRAAEIMTRDVATVRPDTAVRHAIELMAEHSCTSLPVLDDDDRVVGIVSEVDLLRDRMPHDPRSHLRRDDSPQDDPARLVRDVMRDTVVCMPATADSADLAEVMLTNNIRAVPIVDGAMLVGIVSRRDVLRTLLRDDKAIATEVARRLEDYAGTPHRWDVQVQDGIVGIYGSFSSDESHIVEVLAHAVPGVVRVHCHHRWAP
ncbi:MAG TPA: CBS domain-containing protein [Jatrophihabitantaceae bacterium]|nr:CBS domain-containing protein [Jatrophihabitantaceae bacterium]